MLNMSSVEPVKLFLNSRFKFRCHKGIECFTKCCSGIDILLTPYDILRIKNRLEISSGEFLEKYTYTHIDEKSSYPFVMLGMLDDEKKSCPFVTPEGCTIYADRPVNCRYYPIGQGILKKQEGESIINEEFYFFVRESHCLGFKEDKEWTVEEWRVDQEASLYDETNREWKAFLLRKNTPQLDDKKQKMFYMASYDIDRFSSYIFESNFLEVFDMDKDEIERIKMDEVELMKFGFKYLKYILMIEKTLKLKDRSLQA
ncbi:MAG: YkgJ family cysteine cluster protein [Nitrospirae bacterium]|nr:YkgJ family cysteine cluster protein [Nitrospirota bacterium]